MKGSVCPVCNLVIGQNANVQDLDSSTYVGLEQGLAGLDPDAYIDLVNRERNRPAPISARAAQQIQPQPGAVRARINSAAAASSGSVSESHHSNRFSVSGIVHFVQKIAFIAAYAILIPGMLMMLPGVVGFYLVIWNSVIMVSHQHQAASSTFRE